MSQAFRFNGEVTQIAVHTRQSYSGGGFRSVGYVRAAFDSFIQGLRDLFFHRRRLAPVFGPGAPEQLVYRGVVLKHPPAGWHRGQQLYPLCLPFLLIEKGENAMGTWAKPGRGRVFDPGLSPVVAGRNPGRTG